MTGTALFDFFCAIHEYFAAGLFENQNATYLQRHADALTRVLQMGRLPAYNGTRLYPVGKADIYSPNGDETYRFFYPYSVSTRYVPGKTPTEQLWDKAAAADIKPTPFLKRAVDIATDDPALHSFYRGWTHSIINFGRILSEGLGTYEIRITNKLPENLDFYSPLLQVLHAIQNYISRCEQFLRAQKAHQLADAFHQMRKSTPRNLYEAFVFHNFFWFIDGCDDGGLIDAVLTPYRKNETDEEIQQLFHECWLGFYENLSWHATFNSHLNLLAPALQAQRGLNRPNSSVLIYDDTPQNVWDAVFDSWDSGNTNPSLYFQPNYARGLNTKWNVHDHDVDKMAFGGCTELMVQGLSNVGSTDGRLRVLHTLATMDIIADSYDQFYQRLLLNIREAARQTVDKCELGHQVAATYQPNLIRSLFIDDCIDNGREYNDGGARYNSGLIAVVGLTNLVNAVYNIRRAYQGDFSLTDLAQALKDNFVGHDAMLAQLRDTPKFGNDIDDIDTLAAELIQQVFNAITVQSRPHRAYIPFINLFTTYANEGSFVDATADGRLAGTPVGDSFGAVQGTDTAGPTALLNSVTKPDQLNALGTPIVNLRLSKAMLSTPKKRLLTKALIMGYFHQGGLQIQVTVLDTDAMKQAVIHPENYSSLMVRIGGYSEYFVNLTPAVQQEVIKRSEHTV